jgi:hypothetical protein
MLAIKKAGINNGGKSLDIALAWEVLTGALHCFSLFKRFCGFFPLF